MSEGPSFTWRDFLKAGAMLIGVVALLVACVLSWFVFGEWDQVYESRITRASADMAALLYAIDLYTMKYGHAPQELADLAPGARHQAGDACFLPRWPIASPWNTPYHMEVEQKPEGAKVTLWTVPDQKTRERLHKSTFTSDEHPWVGEWPGGAAAASPKVKAGTPCHTRPENVAASTAN